MNQCHEIHARWSPNLAYVIGLIASDGNLSPDGRHISLTSKDYEIVSTAKSILGLKSTIGRKSRGGSQDKKYYVLQFSNVRFYRFLLSIGLTPAKSRTIAKIDVPTIQFADFLRGCIDGDGSIGAYSHPESSKPQIRLRLCSASPAFLHWVHITIKELYEIRGGFYYHDKRGKADILSFGSRDSLTLFGILYYTDQVPALSRKREIAQKYMLEWRNW
ncbi:hypothetical protein BH11PAT2_BH11PAT2_05670 [soil metagenome]